MPRTGKPKTTPRNIRFDPDVLAALEIVAEREERSVAWMVNRAVKEWLEMNERKNSSA